MNVSVISWICVIAWKMLTSRPTMRPAAKIGSATFTATVIACITRLMTTSWFKAASVEALDERLGDEVPAVHQDEQQDLERQGDEDRRQHHHSHAHQGRRDDQVDDQERQEDQEPDLERRLQLADDEGGDQRVGGDVSARLRLLEVRELREQRQVLVARLLEHELAQRLLALLDRLRLADLVVAQRVDRVLLDGREGRGHHEDREEDGDAHQHLVRRSCGRAQAAADEAEDDQDAREARDREQQRGDQRDPGDDEEDLYGVAAAGVDAHLRTVLRRISSMTSLMRIPLFCGRAGSGASSSGASPCSWTSPASRASSSE